MNQDLPRLALAVLALLGGVAFLVLDPTQAVLPQAGRSFALSGLVAGAWMLSLSGFGHGLLWALRVPRASDLGVSTRLALGLSAWGLLSGLLAMAGVFSLATSSVVLMGGLLAWMVGPRPDLRLPSPFVVAVLLVVFLAGSVDAAAPAIGTDERYYQLALPLRMLREGGLLGGLLSPDGSRPMALHLHFAALLGQGGDTAVRLFHLGLVICVLTAVDRLGQRVGGTIGGAVGVLLLAGSWTFVQQAGLAANDLPAALAILAALEAALGGQLILTGVLCGGALAIKYTAGGAVAGILLAARGTWKRRIIAGVCAVGLVAPWWLYNLSQGLHPLFPFSGWPSEMEFQYLDKYGVGRGAVDLLLLPWNAVVHAEIESFHFLGRLSPLWLGVLLPGVLALARSDEGRRIALVGAACFAFWAMGPHWLRYLLPGLPVLAVCGAAGAAWLTSGGPVSRTAGLAVMGASFLLGAPANLGPYLEHLSDRLPAATGQESADDYLARSLDDWPVILHARERLPEDAVVALAFSWSAYHLDRAVILGSVEDHIPTRHFLLTHGEKSLQDLRDAGATHLMTTRVRFRKRIYPFLDDDLFTEQFEEPEVLLDELLLDEATLLHQHGRHRLYRLE